VSQLKQISDNTYEFIAKIYGFDLEVAAIEEARFIFAKRLSLHGVDIKYARRARVLSVRRDPKRSDLYIIALCVTIPNK
jgi:hypothetical protein